MKKVMLIGDSIRLGYQQDVIKELEGEFYVWGTGDNCRFAKYTLNELGRMFEGFSKDSTPEIDNSLLMPTAELKGDIVYPDIIHWNNGLWDTSIVCEEDGAFTPIPEYISYMSKILRELRKVTDKIIFATTTRVKPDNPNQRNEIIAEYNKYIVDFMNKEGVAVNDLNALVSSDIDRFISADNIHLSEDGKAACAKQIAQYVRKIAKGVEI
ncbi:MAG: SGNH/GDSL hydrolase family protein [Clostridiales bacterium]|nr:SGNH/GDSL hydrolase family protein [Clostridiales bacterium]